MEIEANNITEFEKQYYSQSHNTDIPHIVVDLYTDDNFWEELTGNIFKEQLDKINFFKVENNIIKEDMKISVIYIPKYGYIKRINNKYEK